MMFARLKCTGVNETHTNVCMHRDAKWGGNLKVRRARKQVKVWGCLLYMGRSSSISTFRLPFGSTVVVDDARRGNVDGYAGDCV